MRISTQQLFGESILAIQDVQQQQQETQLQISSGKKILTPSDDPVASTRILELRNELELNAQFQRNIELAESKLQLQDAILGNVNEVVQRVRELTVQAGNGVYGPDDLEFIAAEIDQRLEQLVGLMNSQDAGGEFLFAGFQGETAPFSQNSSGSYVYQGDEGRRFVQIEPNLNVSSTVNGKEVFVDVPAASPTFFTSASVTNQANPPARITTGQVNDQEEFETFYPEDITITFNVDTSVVPAADNFSMIETSTGRPILSNVLYNTGQPIAVNGIQFEIVGDPLPGDTFFVTSTPKQGLTGTLEKLIYGLENFDPSAEGRAVFRDVLDQSLANLDNAETAVLDARGTVGARLNTLETTDEQLRDMEVLTTEVLSNLEDIDYAEAVSLLTLQTTTLEAAYSSFASLTQVSLFDII